MNPSNFDADFPPLIPPLTAADTPSMVVTSKTNNSKNLSSDPDPPPMDSDDPNHSANLHLYGYFLSTSMDFPLLKSSLTRLWKPFGLLDITKTKTPSVYYHFTFQTQTGTSHVLDNSPWLVNYIPIFLNRRSPGSPLHKTQPSSIPIWVSFHNVPLELWTAIEISKIASCIGIPKFLDRFTEDRVRYQTGKLGFVRVLIDVPASGKRQDEVQLQFPSINGRPSWVHKVGVKYSWKPPVCSFCHVFGHNLNKCKVSPKAQKNRSDTGQNQ